MCSCDKCQVQFVLFYKTFVLHFLFKLCCVLSDKGQAITLPWTVHVESFFNKEKNRKLY